MDIRDWPFTHSEEEFSQMRELLVDSYTRSSRPLNWRLASIENWNYASRYLEPPEYFIDRVRLWRAGDGELLGFLIRYYDTTYLQVDHRARDLEPRMLVWAEENWVAKDALQTKAFEYDVVRQNLLRERGYSDLGPSVRPNTFDSTISRKAVRVRPCQTLFV